MVPSGRRKPLIAVMCKEQRITLPERAGAAEVASPFQSLDFLATERRFNAYRAEFFPGPGLRRDAAARLPARRWPTLHGDRRVTSR
jgi:hypothetical protein